MKKKSEPIRTCLGCGKKNNKYNLIRLSLKDGYIEVDRKMLMPGRGLYVCYDEECVRRLGKNKKLFKLLKGNESSLYASLSMLLLETKNRSN